MHYHTYLITTTLDTYLSTVTNAVRPDLILLPTKFDKSFSNLISSAGVVKYLFEKCWDHYFSVWYLWVRID